MTPVHRNVAQAIPTKLYPRVAVFILTALAGFAGSTQAASDELPRVQRYAFGSEIPPGFTSVSTPSSVSHGVSGCRIEGPVTQTLSAISASEGFRVHIPLPREGNYRVSVKLGSDTQKATTTVKAELRRLVTGVVTTAAGSYATRTFIVNTRTPRIEAANGVEPGSVKINVPRETVQEAWAWDDALTLEVSGTQPAFSTLEISQVELPTLFLLGDSTVCDQPDEPYASWGQMITRWLTPEIAVANHAESGESLRGSLSKRRIHKIVSQAKPGDVLMLQFGHNDQKQIAAGTGNVASYQAELHEHIRLFAATGGNVILVSSMERRKFDAQGKVIPSLTDYAAAAKQVAAEAKLPFIDLNALSITLYEAMGPEGSALAFACPAGKQDNTHPNSYGGYELALCVLQALREQTTPLSRFISSEFSGFSPAKPDPRSSVQIPESPLRKQAETL